MFAYTHKYKARLKWWCIQCFLGRLSQSVIGYQPGDIIMMATGLVEAAAFGTRKTEINVSEWFKAKNGGDVSVPKG